MFAASMTCDLYYDVNVPGNIVQTWGQSWVKPISDLRRLAVQMK